MIGVKFYVLVIGLPLPWSYSVGRLLLNLKHEKTLYAFNYTQFAHSLNLILSWKCDEEMVSIYVLSYCTLNALTCLFISICNPVSWNSKYLIRNHIISYAFDFIISLANERIASIWHHFTLSIWVDIFFFGLPSEFLLSFGMQPGTAAVVHLTYMITVPWYS